MGTQRGREGNASCPRCQGWQLEGKFFSEPSLGFGAGRLLCGEALCPRKGDLACSFFASLKTSEAQLSRDPCGKLDAEGEVEAQRG